MRTILKAPFTSIIRRETFLLLKRVSLILYIRHIVKSINDYNKISVGILFIPRAILLTPRINL